MDFAPPHIKEENEALFPHTLANYPMHQPLWQDMTNGHLHDMSNGTSDRAFSSHTASLPGFSAGGAFVDDTELFSPFDESGPNNVQQQQQHQRQPPHLVTNGHGYTMPMTFNNNFGISAPMQANRDHLDSFSFSHADGHHQNQFGQSLGQLQGQQVYDQMPMQFPQREHGMSMPIMNQGFRPPPYGSRNQQSPFPGSPQNPTILALQQHQLGTSDMSSPGIHNGVAHRHRFSSGGQLPQALEFSDSPMDTPITSPMDMPRREKKAEMGKSFEPAAKFTPTRSKAAQQKAASLPNGALSKEDLKRMKRRRAHNEVEQKRRDKINERINELSELVPKHRLEDTKLKRQQALSARAGTAMSPNGPSSLRRSSSMSQPAQAPVTLDERDMTKGNSLDTAVVWTRDLMWLLERKLAQQAILFETLEDHGITVPCDIPETEARMATELRVAMDQNNNAEFHYSRDDGSGLYVPQHTDLTGSRVTQQAFANHSHQQKVFPAGYHNQGFEEQVPTPQYSDPEEGSGGFTMSPEPGIGMLDFIREDELDMDMHDMNGM